MSSVSDAAQAQPAEPAERVKATLNCGSHSADIRNMKSFQFDLQFNVYESLWMVDRKPGQGGDEKFRGILSPTGAMLIAGLGKSDDGVRWSYEFSGQKNSRGITILKGSLRSEQPKGMRSCSLSF